MGFKEWIKSEGVHGERRAQAGMNLLTMNASGLMTGKFNYNIKDAILTYEGDSAPASRLGSVAFSADVPEKRMTATRVVAGAVLLGPVGMVIGALAKKQKNGDGWLLIDVLDGPTDDSELRAQWLIEVKKGGRADAMKLANELANAKRAARANSSIDSVSETPGEAS
ncbi:hypothetical protein [uncultured Microbacterium sp.]|uniref:hypothetical protein n=1 Tax=uncultured Microbacterium sp. TaxID=191216 RepID=UPI0025E9F43D|nr:hypothetical protein [uncultured Microbacterium sp.]